MAGKKEVFLVEDESDASSDRPLNVYELSDDEGAAPARAKLPAAPARQPFFGSAAGGRGPSQPASRPPAPEAKERDLWKEFARAREEQKRASATPLARAPAGSAAGASSGGTKQPVQAKIVLSPSRPPGLAGRPTPPTAASVQVSSTSLSRSGSRTDFVATQHPVGRSPLPTAGSAGPLAKPPAPAATSGFGNFSISSGSSRPTGSRASPSMPSSSKVPTKPFDPAKEFAAFRTGSSRFGGMASVSYKTPSGFIHMGTLPQKTAGPSKPYKPSLPVKQPSSKPANPLLASIRAEARAESKQRQVQAPGPVSGVRKPGVSPPRGRPTSRPGRTVFDSSTLEDEDWASNDALKDLIADHEASMQERRSVMAVEGDPIKVSNRRAEREANKAFEKAKLGADTTYLDSEVLSWSFASLSDDRPPFDLRTLKKVPLEFPSIASYRDIFRPLLFLECWEQLSNAKEELGDSAEPLVMRLEAVASVDRFLEITFAVQTKEFKLNSVGENDLVNCVLRPDDGSSSSVAFMGRVISTSMRKDETRTVLKALGGHLLPSLRTQSAWAVTRLMSLTTVHREYAAMLALEYFPLRDEILRPKKGGPPKVDMERIQEVREAYGVNGPQAEVIATVLGASSGFTLCQGPPGTGKTKMILALIASLVKEYRSGAGPAPSKVSINSARKGTHLLVCAPSNAGCDEIVRRLKAGINLPNGETLKIKVVRVGTSDAVHPENLDVFLDNLVQEALLQSDEYQKLPQKDSNKAELNSVQASLRKVREEIDALEAAKKAADPDSEEMVEARVQLREALDRKRALLAKQENARGVASEAEARLAGLKKETRVRILEEADAVLCTLSASGQDMFPQLSQAFQTVIIDEAAQAVELSALIPLKYGAVRCVLVGDPQQLPPTVLSRHAIDLSYEQSLFERLRSAGHYSHLLSIQYRMHPDISVFPSTFFYESRLQDGPGLSLSTRREWHEWLGPYVFFCVEGREASSGHSLYNAREADAAVALVDSLLNRYLRLNFSSRIGIVSPYKKQVGEIKRRLRERYGKDVLNYLDVNSVDGFQGQEKDIIIFSCVRAGSDRGIGFLKDLRRLNVAITRAKASLWILGDASSLSVDSTFMTLIQDAKKRSCFRAFDRSLTQLSSHPPDNWRARASLPGSPVAARPPEVAKKRPNSGDSVAAKRAKN